MALVFIVIGCNSDDKSLDNSTAVSADTPTNEGTTPPDTNMSTEETTEVRRSKPALVETKPSNWYIRLVAEDPAKAMISAGSQLGELEESSAVEKHTLKAFSPFGASYIDVIFVDPDGVASGDYKVNFHSYEEGVEDRWRFTVRTDDNAADILLTWRGLYVLTPYVDEQNRQRYKEYQSMTNPLIKNMKLIDGSNGKEMAAVVNSKAQTYSFNMDGQTERIFEWVVQTDEVSILAQTSKLSTLRAKVAQKDVIINKAEIMKKKAEMFDLNKPPMIKEDMFGK